MDRKNIAKFLQAKQQEAVRRYYKESDYLDGESSDFWDWYDPVPTESTKSYDSYFKELLMGENVSTFHEWATQRRNNGQSMHVADLMGPGNFIQIADVDSILAVTLLDMRTQQEEESNNEKLKIIELDPHTHNLRHRQSGNLYAGITWKKMGDYLENNQLQGFDLMVCRPGLPFQRTAGISGFDSKTLEETALSIYTQLLTRAYKLLSPDQGTLFTQLPNIFKPNKWQDDILPKLEKELRVHNFAIDYASAGIIPDENLPTVLKTIRLPVSPPDFPKLKIKN